MIKRVIADVVLLASFFWLAWYWTALLIFIFMILFRRYWEGVAVAFFIDIIYGHFGIFTFSTLILFWVTEIIKKKLRYFK